MDRPEIAFALAGLGGFNAHGAGFLTAATECGVVPDIVTATSGQILVVAEWLRGTPLRSYIVDQRRENDPLAQGQTALLGLPHVFRPAYAETLLRFWTPPDPNDSLVSILADRFLPAQGYVPDRTDAFFAATADTLNRAEIGGQAVGILFNAYELESGTGILYGNERARELLPHKSNLAPTTPSADIRAWASRPAGELVRPITAEAVKAALWLSLYGFDGLPGGQMDGAYHRSCLVSELHPFRTVYVARPLANGWLGRRPSNAFEVQDWQTEMWFSVAYKAEVDAMIRINQLIDENLLKEESPLRKVDLVEIAPRTPAGYFNYFVERGEVFERAYEEAKSAFRRR